MRLKKWILKFFAYLRTLSLLCSAVRSILNSLRRQLSRLSLSRRLLLMSLVLILFSCFISPLSFSQVSASSQKTGITPTATFHPMFPSPTAGVSPLDCPLSGHVIGWGTLTPNPAWSVVCGRCAPTGTPASTGTPFPLPAWGLTGTAVSELTITLTPIGTGTSTSTPSPTATPSACGGFTIEYLSIGNAGSWPDTSTMDCHAQGENWRCTGVVTQVDQHGTVDYGEAVYFHATGASSLYVSGMTDVSYTVYGDYPNSVAVYTGNGYFGSAFLASTGVTFAGSQSNYDFNVAMAGGGVAGTVITYTYDLLFSRSSSCALVPTPAASPSPTPASHTYCSSIDVSSDTQSFTLPVIMTGEPRCSEVGGYNLPFSWFGLITQALLGFTPPDMYIPKLQVCYQPTSFGTMVLANNTIDLDEFAFVMGALILFWLVV